MEEEGTGDIIRIVVAEDNAALRVALVEFLRLRGSDMAVIADAGDGEEALQKVIATHPDVLVADLRLPGRSGLEIAEQVHSSNLSTAVVLITNETFEMSHADLHGRGICRYLPKKSLATELLREIRASALCTCRNRS